jgi:hypothetical protein
VNLDAIPNLVKKLLSLGLSERELFLDTPVLMSRDTHCLGDFREFKAVHTTEESFLLPYCMMAGNLIRKGFIGTLQRIWMFHSGFRYHALATIKGIVQQRYILRANFIRYGKTNIEMNLVFPNGVKATIIEPRDYQIGRMLIAGSEGLISDYDIDSDMYSCPIYRIGYRTSEQKIIGFTLNHKLCEANDLDRLFFKNIDPSMMPNSTIMNQLKIRALMEFFDLKRKGDRDSLYDYTEGLYDARFVDISTKFKCWYDVPVHLGFSILPAMSRFHLI